MHNKFKKKKYIKNSHKQNVLLYVSTNHVAILKGGKTRRINV